MKKYYRLDNILSYNAVYNMIIGERSNGKSFACLEYALKQYWEDGSEIAYIRRWDEDMRGHTGASIFDGLIFNDRIEQITGGVWNTVYYYSRRWYLAKRKDDGTLLHDERPFCYGFAVNTSEREKGSQFPMVRNIIFDEFLSHKTMGDQEFTMFMNLLSTIIRDSTRTDVKVFMVANTVNWSSIYFREMGLTNVRTMKQGTIEYYEYPNSSSSLALEYCYSDKDKKSQEGERFFAFDSPALSMINTGAWELELYPHCPTKYLPRDVVFTYMVNYEDDILQADVIQLDDGVFTFIHETSKPIDDDTDMLVFSDKPNYQYNRRLNLFRPEDKLGRNILQFFKDNRVYYQDNVVGKIINNYKDWCTTI